MKINLNTPINNTGYGIASLNILKALASTYDISYFPIGSPQIYNQQDYDLIFKLISRADFFDINAPIIKIWHQFDLASRIGRGKYIAYPFFELDTFNEKERKHLSVPDVIATTSEWSKEVLINNGIKSPISIVPLGVDRSIFNDNIITTRTDDRYIFLTIGKWEIRKGHDLLPQIFNKAFPTENNVELWILAAEHTNTYSNKEELSRWKNLYKSDRIKVIPGLPTSIDIAQLIAESDCGIYISRAEGWNLELLETMSMNRPVIATNYSAHTEFCNDKNCLLVDIEDTEKAVDGKAFVGQGNWAKINTKQIDQCVEYMRYVFRNRIRTNPHGVETAKKYSWENSASQITRCING